MLSGVLKTLYAGVLICGKYGAFETKRRHHLRHCFAKVSVYAVVEAKQGDSLSPRRYLHLYMKSRLRQTMPDFILRLRVLNILR